MKFFRSAFICSSISFFQLCHPFFSLTVQPVPLSFFLLFSLFYTPSHFSLLFALPKLYHFKYFGIANYLKQPQLALPFYCDPDLIGLTSDQRGQGLCSCPRPRCRHIGEGTALVVSVCANTLQILILLLVYYEKWYCNDLLGSNFMETTETQNYNFFAYIYIF